MSDENRFTVLVSTDGGINWRRHAGIIASNGEQACKRVRDAHNSGGSDADALFYATQAFRPRKIVMKHIEIKKPVMQQVDLDPPDAGPTEEEAYAEEVEALEPGTPAPMPHEPQPGDSSVAPGEFER